MTIYIHPADEYNPHTGYGKMSIGLRDSLKRNGYQVRNYSPRIKGKDVLVIGHPYAPGEFADLQKNNAWLYTMSESDRVSPTWVDLINANYKGVIVPCRDLLDIYRASGVTIPVHYIPLGLGKALATVKQPQRESGHVIIGYSLGDTRKGDDLTLFAFMEVFGGDPAAKLIMKARGKSLWDGCREPQVQVISDTLSEVQWHELLSTGDMFVFPSRGEGFGLPPREATMVGVPTIATKWLGTVDIGRWGFPIRVAGYSPGMFGYYGANAEDCQWAEPDYEHLVKQMRAVRDNPEIARQQVKDGQKYLAKMCDWNEIAQAIGMVFRAGH